MLRLTQGDSHVGFPRRPAKRKSQSFDTPLVQVLSVRIPITSVILHACCRMRYRRHMSVRRSEKEGQQEQQHWEQLVSELDCELLRFGAVRLEMGRILYQMKVHLKGHGLDAGRSGRWKPMLAKRKIAVSTANDWVRKYEESANFPAPQRFFAPPTTRKTPAQKKSTVSALFTHQPSITPADLNDPKKKKIDSNGRLAVECVFVLTLPEKTAFMESVKRLGPSRATQIIYEAVVAAPTATADAKKAGA